MTQWSELLETLGRSEDEVLDLDPQEQRQELSFPVTIQLDDQQLRLKSGSSLPLQVGMSLTANIKLRKVSYFAAAAGRIPGQGGIAAASLSQCGSFSFIKTFPGSTSTSFSAWPSRASTNWCCPCWARR